MKPPVTLVGIDVGGTKVAGAWITLPDGPRSTARTLPTRPERGGRALLDDVQRLAAELIEDARSAGAPAVGLGLGICELVDRDRRLASANCIRWLDLPVVAELGRLLPVTLEADVRAAALAAHELGAGRRVRTFLYVTVGTGISCCLMHDGQPWLGARGASGTMASSPLGIPCDHCQHTVRHSLEEIASGPALVSRYRALGGNSISAREVFAAARTGTPTALSVVRTAAEALGAQIGLMVNVLDPEAVIIGGGLGTATGPGWDQLPDLIRRHIWSTTRNDLPVVADELGADAGWIGAAVAAWRAQGLSAGKPTAPRPSP